MIHHTLVAEKLSPKHQNHKIRLYLKFTKGAERTPQEQRWRELCDDGDEGSRCDESGGGRSSCDARDDREIVQCERWQRRKKLVRPEKKQLVRKKLRFLKLMMESKRNTYYKILARSGKMIDQNLALCPKGIGVSLEQWTTFIDYKLKSRTQKTANKRIFTRAEMYPISYKKNDESFVNDEAREKSEQLALFQANESSPNDDVYIKLFGKEHPDRVRGVKFGVCPSQVMNSTNSFRGASSSCNHNFDMTKIFSMEIELQENKAIIFLLQAQYHMTFLQL
ncbi:hypothetical protein Ahy_B10g105617 [Arachis hypogaea]|uniref:Uncharacterized protein n=1 Tax=Arachis hypogaea TaxID=3818 RepID=A0A444X8I4_ARAHY|nr:hypothetical protein Ahy_B10g105617 [Arachis hypogaea]